MPRLLAQQNDIIEEHGPRRYPQGVHATASCMDACCQPTAWSHQVVVLVRTGVTGDGAQCGSSFTKRSNCMVLLGGVQQGRHRGTRVASDRGGRLRAVPANTESERDAFYPDLFKGDRRESSAVALSEPHSGPAPTLRHAARLLPAFLSPSPVPSPSTQGTTSQSLTWVCYSTPAPEWRAAPWQGARGCAAHPAAAATLRPGCCCYPAPQSSRDSHAAR